MIQQSKIGKYIFISTIGLLYIPVLVLIFTSFNASRFGNAWNGFSLQWYQRLLHEPTIWSALLNSLFAAIFSSCAATILGTGAAFALYRYRSRLQKIHLWLIVSPLFIPDILMGMSLLLLFVFFQMKLSLFTVFLAHTTFSMSYVVMIVRARLDTLDTSIVEAALDLGASSWNSFRYITLPYCMPAILSSLLLAFTLSFDDFVITFFVVGPGATTLPVYVYSMMKFGSPPIINALSTLLFVFTGALTALSYRLAKENNIQ